MRDRRDASKPGKDLQRWLRGLAYRSRVCLRSPRLRPQRLVAARFGRTLLPSFLIVGAQKGGTTALYAYLQRHPLVFKALRKEIQYFTVKYRRSWSWYLAHFPLLGPRTVNGVTGEASPYYLYHPLAPARVAAALPNVRCIALLRDPVTRAYSHYRHNVRLGFESLSFADAVQRESRDIEHECKLVSEGDVVASSLHRHGSYLSRGLYIEQLERWFGHVSSDRFLIVRSEELFRDPGVVVDRVLQFLNLEPVGRADYKAVNVGRSGWADGSMRAQLAELFRKPNAALSQRIGIDISEWTGS